MTFFRRTSLILPRRLKKDYVAIGPMANKLHQKFNIFPSHSFQMFYLKKKGSFTKIRQYYHKTLLTWFIYKD